MANEPERPIEKLLRAAAKKRRDEAGAPLELHLATRRLLQGEVGRTYATPKRESRSFIEALGQLWPRVAGGVAIFALLVLAGYMLLPVPDKNKRGALMAKNELMPQARASKQPLPPPLTAAVPAPAPPASAVESSPSTVTFAETAPTAPAKSDRLFKLQPQPLSKDMVDALTDREAKEKPAPAAAPQFADRQKAAEANIAASGRISAQALSGSANGAYQRQFGFAGKPAPAAGAPAASASPAPVVTTAPAASVVTADESAKQLGDKADQPSFAYKSPPVVALANRPKSSSTVADGLLKSVEEDRLEVRSVGVSQRFAQVALGAKKKSGLDDKSIPTHSVLASFEVEQAGPELRIVDGDGSVYSGYVQIADAARRRLAAPAGASAITRAPQASGGVREEKATAGRDADQRAPQAYFFRVAGTNRSLHKKVVFSGNLLAATNSPSFQAFTNLLSLGGGLGGQRTGSAQLNLLPLLNSRISGKVVVGNGKAVEINALPTSP
jgi:hypothetical protein